MFPGSVNSPLHRTCSSNARSPNSVLKLWEPVNAQVSMCLKVGDEAAELQSKNPSKIQGHRTATRLWACGITILGWPGVLQHLSIWDLILKWEDHQSNFHNDPTSSGLTVRKRNADRMPEPCQEVKDIRSQRNASKSSVTPIWMWEKRQEPSSSSSGGRCRKRAVKTPSRRSFLFDQWGNWGSVKAEDKAAGPAGAGASMVTGHGWAPSGPRSHVGASCCKYSPERPMEETLASWEPVFLFANRNNTGPVRLTALERI